MTKKKEANGFPIQISCVCVLWCTLSPCSDERFNKTATLHIVHRKTQNKSHVCALNVLQTSYITCSFTYLCTKWLFFIFAHLMWLHRAMRLVGCRFYFLRKEGEKRKKLMIFYDSRWATNKMLYDLHFGGFVSVSCFLSFFLQVAHANC